MTDRAAIEALRKAERILVKIGAALPSSVVQKLPTKLLIEWGETKNMLRALLAEAAP